MPLKCILPVCYAAPITHWAVMVQHHSLMWEVHENYPKQTFRNRIYIHGANGAMMLSIPIKHLGSNGHQSYKKVQIDNRFDWQRNHWKSIQTAYRSSPFFEFYEDEIRPFFTTSYVSLFDFNVHFMMLIAQFIGVHLEFNRTFEYLKNYDNHLDYRSWANPKKQKKYDLPSYIQTFGDKNGFLPNLSILDLIFHEGPQTKNYLTKIIL